MNSERDPKKYPKAGDVLTRFGTIRHVTGVATNVRGTLIRVFFDGGDPGDRTCSVSIGAWRGWTQDDCQVLLRDETSDEGETPQMLIATHRCGGLVASSWLDDGFDEVNRRLGHDWHAKGYLVSKISVPDGTPMMRWCECNRQGQQDIGDKSTCTCGPVRHWECNSGCKAKHVTESVAAQATVPDGWPTEEMISAFADEFSVYRQRETFGPAFRAALAAAPKVPQTADDAATLRSAIRDMALLLRSREWADQFNTDHDVTDLEVQITELVGTATELCEQHAALVAALERMLAMHDTMMTKVNHGASFFDADCLREMNEAPSQAAQAIASTKGGAQ